MKAAHQPQPDVPILLRRDAGGVTTLTLNRPDARNALSMALMTELRRALDEIAGDEKVRVVVIGAAGSVFCAGHDLKEIRATPTRAAYEALFQQCSALMLALTRLTKPVIAKVQGMATAGGCQLVATCDLAIAANTARFATPGVNIGLFCSTPMVALSRTVGRKPALEMLLTGDAIDATEAARIGLINRAVEAADLDGEVAALAGRIAAKSPLTLGIGKAAFYRQIEMDIQSAYSFASETMTANMLAADAAEGIDAFMAKRAPKWRGR